jgi:hypothetical protein
MQFDQLKRREFIMLLGGASAGAVCGRRKAPGAHAIAPVAHAAAASRDAIGAVIGVRTVDAAAAPQARLCIRAST